MKQNLEDRIRERAYFLSLSGGGADDGTYFWLMAEREVLAEVAIEPSATSQFAETVQLVEIAKPTAVLQATEQPLAAEQPYKTAQNRLAAANGSAVQAKARLIADITKGTRPQF